MTSIELDEMLIGISTFMTLNLVDSPLRSLVYFAYLFTFGASLYYMVKNNQLNQFLGLF